MSNTAQHAKQGLVVVDGSDLSELLSRAEPAFDRDNVDTSTFHLSDKTNIPGMRGCQLATEGFRVGSLEAYQEVIDRAINNAQNHDILSAPYAPRGSEVGEQCYLMQSNQSAATVGGTVTGAVMLTANFDCADKARLGVIVHSHRGSDTLSNAAAFTVTLTDVDGDRTITFYNADGTEAGSVTLGTDDNESDFQTALQALGGDYADATVTVES